MPRRLVIERGALRTLAALLLVDGRALPADELARIALPHGGCVPTLRTLWIPALRAAGCRIETLDFRGTGYRLLAIPPDHLLDDLLLVAHLLRAEHPTRLWELFGATCPIRKPSSPPSSARRSA